MKKTYKCLCALLLTLVLLVGFLPAGPIQAKAATNEFSAEDYAAVDQVFDRIDQVLEAPAKKNATDAQKIEAAIEVVKASKNYVEGSLERNGNVFTWWTEEGISCMYNPRMQEIKKNQTPETRVDEIVNEPAAVRGGSPVGKEVYVIGPYYGSDDSFTNQYMMEARHVAKAIGDTDGYTLYSGAAATIDKVAEAVSNGAVVFFDSHGTTDYENPYNKYDCITGATYSYLCLSTAEGITSADYNAGAYYDGEHAYVNGKTIANHMTKNSPGGIIWMAICLGMGTDTICKPLREKGVEVVYGYSESVTFGGDYLYEETFWNEMLLGKTVAQSVSAMKNAWGNWDWSNKIANYYNYRDGYNTIEEAREEFVAFPVVVSDADTHPGKRTATGDNTNGFYGADSLQNVQSTYKFSQVYEVTDPTDPGEILREAYSLKPGEDLAYEATLTGKIIQVTTIYRARNNDVTVIMEVPGYETMPIKCCCLSGSGADQIGVGDTITVKGTITNGDGEIEFKQGCQLTSWTSGGVVNPDDGDIEIDIPLNPKPPEEEIKLTKVNVDFGSSMTLNFNHLASVLDQYEDVYVLFEVEGREPVRVSEYTLSGSGAELRYNFGYEGLTIMDMDKTVYATIYGTYGGKEYVGEKKNYSLLTYATNALDPENRDVVPCANLLKYAMAAEAYKQVPKEERLENKLTENQKTVMEAHAYADNEINVTENKDVKNGTLVRFVSQNVDMESRIALIFFVAIDDSVDTSKLTFRMDYKDGKGNDTHKVYTFSDLVKDEKKNRYELSFSDLLATQMKQRVKCTILIDGEEHGYYDNSIENYCYKTINNPDESKAMKDLATRISLYGDACANTYGN